MMRWCGMGVLPRMAGETMGERDGFVICAWI